MKIDRHSGLWPALGAYGAWGVLVVFWKQLGHVPTWEQLLHRIVWSAVTFGVLVLLTGGGPRLRAVFRTPATLRWFVLSGVLIASNWLVFLYSVQTDRVVHSALGYFITPLLNMALGAVVLRERLSPATGVAIGLAASGVGVMTWAIGGVPWIALVLAGVFSTYGLVRKQAPEESLVGGATELWLLAPFALVGLIWVESSGGRLASASATTWALLLATGPITALPLLWFAMAARRLRLSTLGFVQFFAPTLQLAIGVRLYGEEFDTGRAVAFGLIWLACGVFAVEQVQRSRASATSR